MADNRGSFLTHSVAYTYFMILQENGEQCYNTGSADPRRQLELQELKEQSDLYRSRLMECRSQGDVLIAQRNGEK